MGRPEKPGLLRVVVCGNVDAGKAFRGPRLHEGTMGRPILDQQDQPVFADEWLQVDPADEHSNVYYRIPNIVEENGTVSQLPMEDAVNFYKVPLDNSDEGEPNKRGSDPLPTNILYVRLRPKTERERDMILEDAMASFTDNQDAGGGIETIQNGEFGSSPSESTRTSTTAPATRTLNRMRAVRRRGSARRTSQSGLWACRGVCCSCTPAI